MTEAELQAALESVLQAALESVADAYGRLAKAIMETQRASKNLTQAEVALWTVLISIDPRGMQSWLNVREAAK